MLNINRFLEDTEDALVVFKTRYDSYIAFLCNPEYVTQAVSTVEETNGESEHYFWGCSEYVPHVFAATAESAINKLDNEYSKLNASHQRLAEVILSRGAELDSPYDHLNPASIISEFPVTN